MTTIVTADKLVTALAQRVNAGADTSVSGPNKQLKDAMVAKHFFDGGGGGGGGGAQRGHFYATAYMEPVREFSGNGIKTPTVTRRSSWTNNPAEYYPNDTLYPKWLWNGATVSDNSFGSWQQSNTRFVFSKRTVATVTFNGGIVIQLGSPSNYDTILAVLGSGNTGVADGWFDSVQQAPEVYRGNSNLYWLYAATTITRVFEPNDYIEARYAIITADGTFGSGGYGFYGSMRGYKSYMNIMGYEA